MSDKYVQLCKVAGLIIFIFILLISDKLILFPNPGADQRWVLGINVGHLKGAGEDFLVIYLGGFPCANPNVSKVSLAAAFREGNQ